MMDFFGFFFIWGCFFHFIAFGFSPSGFGYDGFFFLIWVVFFHFIAFGLSLLGLDYDGFFCFFFFIWGFFFHLIAFGLSLSGLGYDGFFLFFDLGLLFPLYCLWFKTVGFRLWWIFFVFFLFRASSSILLPLV